MKLTERQSSKLYILSNPATRDFAPFFHASMSPKSTIKGIPAKSETGVQQGAPDATFSFTQVIHKDIKKLHDTLKEVNGATVFFSDDGYVVGPSATVFPALDVFKTNLYSRTKLSLVTSKCKVFSTNISSVREYFNSHTNYKYDEQLGVGYKLGALDDVDLDTAKFGDGFGITILGVPIGDRKYKNAILNEKFNTIRDDIFNQTRILNSDRPNGSGVDLQLSQCILLSCVLPRFDYWLQNMPPSETEVYARKVDKLFLSTLSNMADQKFENEGDLTTRRLRLPIRHYGAGVNSKESLAPVAYAATMVKVLRSLRDFTDPYTNIRIPGFNNDLWDLLCKVDNNDGTSSNELANFVNFTRDTHKCPNLSRAFESAYSRIQLAAGSPTDGALAININDLANSNLANVLRTPQRAFNHQLDDIRAKLLDDEIKNLPKNNMVRLAWLNTSTYISSFLRSVPEVREAVRAHNAQKFEDNLEDWEIKTMWAIWLGLEIPWLKSYVGQKIGDSQRTIDAYGANLMACTGLTGDYWRARHDKIKLFLFKLMRWGRMEPSLEVANIFSGKISTNSMNHNNLEAHENPSMTWQENWNRQPGRGKQAYVPDLTFILRLKEVLAEIKTANGQDSNLYLNANDERRNAINTRAKRIHRDIKRKLHEVDQKWNQSGDTMGPCETHLTTYGKVKELAIGAFGEWSDDVHIVIQACAARIAHCTWQESGYSDEEDACAILTTYCFKKLAILSLREVAVLLRNRVNQIGIGNKETRKNNKQYIMRAIRAADLARLEHARMHEALRN